MRKRRWIAVGFSLLMTAAIALAALGIVWFVHWQAHRPLAPAWKAQFGGWLWHLAFTPDSRWLIAGNPQQIAVWDVATGRLARSLPVRHFDFAISPDGKYFAVSISDMLELWELARGRRLWAQWSKHWGDILHLAFSPDGQYVATCGQDGLTVKLWRVTDGKLARIFWTKGLITFAFSPDGKLLATTEATDTGYIVCLWDVTNKKHIGTLPSGQRHEIVATAKITGTQSGSIQLKLQFGGEPLVFLPNGQMLAAGELNGVRFWNVPQRKMVGLMPAKTLRVFDLHPEAAIVAINDRWHYWDRLRLVGLKDPRTIGMWLLDWKPATKPVVAVTFSPDGKWLAVGRHDGTVWLFRLVGHR